MHCCWYSQSDCIRLFGKWKEWLYLRLRRNFNLDINKTQFPDGIHYVSAWVDFNCRQGEKNCRKKNGGLILWWEAIKRKRDRWISNLLMAEYGGIWLKIHRLWPCHSSQHPAYKPQGYDLSPWWLILLTIQSLNGYRQSPQEVPGRRVGGIFRELDTKKNIKKNKSCHGYRRLILLMWELGGCQKTENSFVYKSDTYILNAVVNACKICFIKSVTGFDIIDVFFFIVLDMLLCCFISVFVINIVGSECEHVFAMLHWTAGRHPIAYIFLFFLIG